MAMPAQNSSVSMPAAPTSARRHLLVKALAPLTSTYGTGITTSVMMPASCTEAPQIFAAVAVAEFVQQLEHREGHRQDQHVVARQHPVGEVVGQRAPVQRREHGAPADHAEPQQQSPHRGQNGRTSADGRVEETVRIAERNAQVERIGQPPPQLAGLDAVRPVGQFGEVGQALGGQQVGGVELAPEGGSVRPASAAPRRVGRGRSRSSSSVWLPSISPIACRAAGAKRCTVFSTRSSRTNQRSPRKCWRVMRHVLAQARPRPRRRGTIGAEEWLGGGHVSVPWPGLARSATSCGARRKEVVGGRATPGHDTSPTAGSDTLPTAEHDTYVTAGHRRTPNSRP